MNTTHQGSQAASAEYVGHDLSMHIRETKISATITKGLFGVIDTHQM